MKSTAFAPGHISGFFEPIYNQDLSRTGSRGAGININLGAISEVQATESANQSIQVKINNKKVKSPLIDLATKYLIGKNPIKIAVNIKLALPLGQGFGMSAAGTLSSSLALAHLINLDSSVALKASHFAEVQMRTGLGDVMASKFGGIEIRKEAGLPPWGVIEHIPGKGEIVLCIIGKKLDTKKVLMDASKTDLIPQYGKYCTKKLLESPSIESFFSLSQHFTKKTGLADRKILDAINAADNYGVASMCMLGNSVFAMGKTDKLLKALNPFGKVYLCKIDEIGARVIN